jgi:hypothetical protein
VLGLLLAFGQPAGASATSHASPHTSAVAAAIATLKQLEIGDHATNHAAGHGVKVKGLTQAQGLNWAGYAEAPGSGNKILRLPDSGTWTETGATVNCGVTADDSDSDDECTMTGNSGTV